MLRCRWSVDCMLLALVLVICGTGSTQAKDGDAPALAAAIKDLATGDAAAKEAAADLIGVMGPAAESAVPALSAALADESPVVRAHAALALAQIGEKAKDAGASLAKLVADKDGKVRRAALKALRSIKPDRNVTLPIISQALADADPATRVHALHSIANMGEAAVPALIKAMEHSEGKYWALLVLGELGPKAKDAVPGMTKLVSDESTQVRREAVMALGMVGPDAASAVPAIAKALNDKEMSVRFGAAFALAMLGPNAKAAIPALEAELKSKDEFMQVEAAWALAKIKDKDPAAMDTAVKVLTQGVASKDNAVQRASVRALLDLKPGPAKVLPALKKAFDEADPEVVEESLHVMAEVGEPGIPAILVALKMKEMRGRAAEILGHMGPKAAKAVGPLTEALADDRPEVRREICFALGAIGPDAASATPTLIKLLSDEESPVRHGAAYALGRIGEGAKEAVPALKKQLKSEDSFEQGVSAWALAYIVHDDPEMAKEVSPLLVRGLSNDQPMVRAACAKALGKLGKNAVGAAKALEEATKDSDETVSAAAKEALTATSGK